MKLWKLRGRCLENHSIQCWFWKIASPWKRKALAHFPRHLTRQQCICIFTVCAFPKQGANGCGFNPEIPTVMHFQGQTWLNKKVEASCRRYLLGCTGEQRTDLLLPPPCRSWLTRDLIMPESSINHKEPGGRTQSINSVLAYGSSTCPCPFFSTSPFSMLNPGPCVVCLRNTDQPWLSSYWPALSVNPELL